MNTMPDIETIAYLEHYFTPDCEADKIRLEKIKNDPTLTAECVKKIHKLNDLKRKEMEDKYGFLYFKLRTQMSNDVLKYAFIESIRQIS